MKKLSNNKNRKEILNDNLKEIVKEDKEIILNIAFISALMLNNKSNKRKELERVIKIANIEDINIANIGIDKKKKRKPEDYQIKDILGIDAINAISPKDILELLVNLASDIELFDTLEELNFLLEKYRSDIIIYGNDEVSQKQKELKYTAKDNLYQYDVDKQTMAEVFANTAWLSNKLAHIFQEAQENDSIDISKKQIHLKKSLMRIKDFCIHKIIEEKKKGADVKLEIRNDINIATGNKFEQTISIVLPHYLQPIMLHLPSDELSEVEKNICNDKDITDIYCEGIGAIFPLKLTQEKEELLSYLSKNIYSTFHNQKLPHIARLEWYFDKNKEEKQKIRNNTKELQKNKKLKGSKASINVLQENKLMLNKIGQDLGIVFPQYFLDKMLLRSAYSFQHFINKISIDAREILQNKGVKECDLDKEIEKLFIHMKITQPVSSLVQQKKGSNILKQKIDDSISEYNITYRFIINNLKNYTDYQTMKIKLNERIKQSSQKDNCN